MASLAKPSYRTYEVYAENPDGEFVRVDFHTLRSTPAALPFVSENAAIEYGDDSYVVERPAHSWEIKAAERRDAMPPVGPDEDWWSGSEGMGVAA